MALPQAGLLQDGTRPAFSQDPIVPRSRPVVRAMALCDQPRACSAATSSNRAWRAACLSSLRCWLRDGGRGWEGGAGGTATVVVISAVAAFAAARMAR